MTSPLRFYSVDYFGTGQGVTYYLQVSNRDDIESFKSFINNDYYSLGIEELSREVFMCKYDDIIPSYVKDSINRDIKATFTWRTHLHINYA